MGKLINLELYKNRRNRQENIKKASKYLKQNVKSPNLDARLFHYIVDEIAQSGGLTMYLNTTKLSKQFNTTPYKINKAYQVLLDNGVMEVIEREPRKPIRVSIANFFLAYNQLEEYNKRKRNECY